VDVRVKSAGTECVLTVKDTGIGIPAADRERVFERFYRVDKSHSRQIGGTGLGLSIVKHAAAYLGGTIELESEEGKGTTVTIIFKK
ncbi:MAG: histidine kinase, partial [Firmicutes bacterium]|nr:histidine kinase [Bacillota bacterium]